MSQIPSVGRIVHYQKFGTACGTHKPTPSAATITEVLDKDTMKCQLFVMNANGVYFNATPYSVMPKPGHWSWPPRHAETRMTNEGVFEYDESTDQWSLK